MRLSRSLWSMPALLLLAACGDGGSATLPPAADAGTSPDAGLLEFPDDAGTPPDAGDHPTLDFDAGTPPTPDAGTPDAGTPDAGSPDAGTPPAANTDPTQPGTHAGAAAPRLQGTLTRAGRKIPYSAVVPDTLPAPVVIFSPGFTVDSANYDELMTHLASHGFLAVRCDPPVTLRDSSHTAGADDLVAMIDEVARAGGPFAGKADTTRIGLAGHSLGGKLATMATAQDGRVGALFAIDPVNGQKQSFQGNSYDADHPNIVPAVVNMINVPAGFMGETVNGAGTFLGPGCAPTDQNFETFYSASTASRWTAQWDVLGANHAQFVDTYEPACTSGQVWTRPFWCQLCQGGSAVSAEVKATTHTLAAAFFRRHLNGETTMDPFLIGDRAPGGVTIEHRP